MARQWEEFLMSENPPLYKAYLEQQMTEKLKHEKRSALLCKLLQDLLDLKTMKDRVKKDTGNTPLLYEQEMPKLWDRVRDVLTLTDGHNYYDKILRESMELLEQVIGHGRGMAALCFNIGQEAYGQVTERDREAMKELQESWDTLVRSIRS